MSSIVSMMWQYNKTRGRNFWHFEGPKGDNLGDTCHHSQGATWSDDFISKISILEVEDVNTL